jgi:DNA-binding NarL/FixJ family response regulator
MSSRHSVLITGAPSGMGAVYANSFPRRSSRDAFISGGRTRTKAAVGKPFRLTGQKRPVREDEICLEEHLKERARNGSHIGILSIDGHPVVREGIGAIINSQADMSLVSATGTGKEGIEAYRAARPDVTLLDLQLPDLSGIEILIGIRSEFPDARIIILATCERDVEIRRALKAGAYGYLLKSVPPQQMLESIRRVHSGHKCVPWEIASGLAEHLSDENLSEREIEVLRHVADGKRNRDIGETLSIAEETVKVHLRHIKAKLGASDRTHSVAIAARRGFLYL